MFILYIGNFISSNGPATVDKSLLNISNEIYPLQISKKYYLLMIFQIFLSVIFVTYLEYHL